MARGRTLTKFLRLYENGNDLSGFSRAFATAGVMYDEADMTANFSDAVKGAFPGHGKVQFGPYSAVFDNTASTGIHALLATPDTARTLMMPIGIQAAPAQGDPVFCSIQNQLSYQLVDNGGAATLAINFALDESSNLGFGYSNPFGVLLHAKSAETAVNAAIGVDNDTGGATTLGGYLMVHIFASAGGGSVVLKVQDASTNLDGSFGDLSGATTGSIAAASIPYSAVVALSKTATVKEFLRWQMVLTTMTSCTFALAFVRSYAGQ